MAQETLDSGEAPRRLLVFNDNEEDHLSSRRGGGNAVVRPLNEHGAHAAHPLSAGVCTGRSAASGGYQALTRGVRATVEANIRRIERILDLRCPVGTASGKSRSGRRPGSQRGLRRRAQAGGRRR